MNVAVRDAPGVSSGFNWITDIGPPIDPNSLSSYQLPSGGADVFYFFLGNQYNTANTTDQNAASAMTFNQMGILGGPLKHADGTPNVGGVVTLSLLQVPSTGGASSVLAQAGIDLTTWVPGQFYWSDLLPTPVHVWGQIYTPSPPKITNFFHIVAITCPVRYSLYHNRPVTLRNGSSWGSMQGNFQGVGSNNDDHFCLAGPVDFTLTTYADLGTASLTPTFALSGHVQSEGHFGASPPNESSSFTPRIQLKSRLHTIGDLGSADMSPQVVLAATSMAGGPLWKPSKLCSG